MSTTTKKPRPASTVILTRWYDTEPQVYILKRSARSGFMPGNYVFPGGTLDTEDWDSPFWKAHLDMDLDWVSRRLGGGMTAEEAIAHGVAAIRETFEEAGVFLGQPSKQIEEHLHRFCDRRMASSLPKGWLREWLISEGWALAFSRLSPWAHWITPIIRSRRYDTRFFVALMPPGQECIPDSWETTHGIWISAEEGLAGNLKGEIGLSPPTLVTLHELLKCSEMGGLEKEVETRPWGEARLPRLIPLSGTAMILLPWDPMYDQEFEISTKKMGSKAVPLGEPFSRLWYAGGIWRPVQV